MRETRLWFKYYPDDFLMDTAGLSDQAVGVYIRLLSIQWKVGKLSTNYQYLSKITSISSRLLRKMLSTTLKDYFEFRDGYFYNRRLEREREDATAQSDRSREHGKLGGRPVTQWVMEPETQTKPIKSKSIDNRVKIENVDIYSKKSASPKGLSLENLFHIHISSFTERKRNERKDALVFDDMLRLDNRTSEQIEFVINWLGSGSKQAEFWKPNILSAYKLRTSKDGVKYFDRLVLEIKRENTANPQDGMTDVGRRTARNAVEVLKEMAAADLLRDLAQDGR